MFSFFKSKKSSPPSSPENEPNTGQDNDFVLVDPRNRDPNLPLPPGPASSLYPNFDQGFGMPPTAVPVLPPSNKENTMHPVNYLHGVPFKLSSELSTGDANEITKIQIDDILAMITSKMEVSQPDYDFGLERNVISQEVTD